MKNKEMKYDNKIMKWKWNENNNNNNEIIMKNMKIMK